MKKKILSAIFAGLMTFNIFGNTDDVQAATRAEIAAIKVTKPADFKYWADKSAVKRQIINYVKDVTNKHSKNYIPVEDRIAVFDMDGTILCETAPTSLGYMFVL
ncbi:MAG: haloacid dehalogenase-like hydrolase, partial [Selenomonadaceae bacterium]|nr:haloacid dehalogenase-like hydrolase [Selenomonadaceae bacterium]